MFADWTDRIAAGELPPVPARPQGVERNVVITEWDWADPKAYLHDEIATDKRNPTVNANGLLYGPCSAPGRWVYAATHAIIRRFGVRGNSKNQSGMPI